MNAMFEVCVKQFAASLIIFISFWPYEAVNSQGFCYISVTKDELATKLWGPSSNYNKTKLTRPNLAKLMAENPLAHPALAAEDIVEIGIEIEAIKIIDDRRNEFMLQLMLKQYWNDYRLKYDTDVDCYGSEQDYYEVFEMVDFASIWKPKLNVKNMVDSPTELKGEFYIYPNGNVKFTQSSLYTLSCNLGFLHFPYETQKCSIVVASASETSNITLIYSEIPIINHVSDFIADTVEWNLTDYEPKSDNYNPGPQSSLNFSIDMKRQTEGYYKDFVIIPVILMVIFGWASFFVSRTAVPARVAMNNVGFLTISNLLAQRLSYLPRIGAKEAYILRFMMISLIFSGYCIVQFIFVNYLTRVEKRTDKTYQLAKKAKQKKIMKEMEERQSLRERLQVMNIDVDDDELENVAPCRDDMLEFGIHKIDCFMLKPDGTMRFKDQHIDIFSRYVYPTLYFISFIYFQSKWDSV